MSNLFERLEINALSSANNTTRTQSGHNVSGNQAVPSPRSVSLYNAADAADVGPGFGLERTVLWSTRKDSLSGSSGIHPTTESSMGTKRQYVDNSSPQKYADVSPSKANPAEDEEKIIDINKLKLFTIPKKKKARKDVLEDISIESREFQHELRSIISTSYMVRNAEKSFRYFRARMVHNSNLASVFLEKRKELRLEHGYSEKEVQDSYAFLCLNSEHEVQKICQEGVKIGNTSITCLGNPQMGVYLCKHADLVKGSPFSHGESGKLVIFKTIKGKVKAMVENRGVALDPTPNFDCHMAKLSNLDLTANPQAAYESSQLYLYEYGDVGMEERPKHIQPYCVVDFTYVGDTKRPPLIKQLAKVSHTGHVSPQAGRSPILSTQPRQSPLLHSPQLSPKSPAFQPFSSPVRLSSPQIQTPSPGSQSLPASLPPPQSPAPSPGSQTHGLSPLLPTPMAPPQTPTPSPGSQSHGLSPLLPNPMALHQTPTPSPSSQTHVLSPLLPTPMAPPQTATPSPGSQSSFGLSNTLPAGKTLPQSPGIQGSSSAGILPTSRMHPQSPSVQSTATLGHLAKPRVPLQSSGILGSGNLGLLPTPRAPPQSPGIPSTGSIGLLPTPSPRVPLESPGVQSTPFLGLLPTPRVPPQSPGVQSTGSSGLLPSPRYPSQSPMMHPMGSSIHFLDQSPGMLSTGSSGPLPPQSPGGLSSCSSFLSSPRLPPQSPAVPSTSSSTYTPSQMSSLSPGFQAVESPGQCQRSHVLRENLDIFGDFSMNEETAMIEDGKRRKRKKLLLRNVGRQTDDQGIVVWAGDVVANGVVMFPVEMVSYMQNIKPVRIGSQLNIDNGASLETVRSLYLQDVQSLSKTCETEVNGKFYRYCQLLPVKASQADFNLLVNYLTQTPCAAVVKEENVTMILLPSGDFIQSLGLTGPYIFPMMLHCVIMTSSSRKATLTRCSAEEASCQDTDLRNISGSLSSPEFNAGQSLLAPPFALPQQSIFGEVVSQAASQPSRANTSGDSVFDNGFRKFVPVESLVYKATLDREFLSQTELQDKKNIEIARKLKLQRPVPPQSQLTSPATSVVSAQTSAMLYPDNKATSMLWNQFPMMQNPQPPDTFMALQQQQQQQLSAGGDYLGQPGHYGQVNTYPPPSPSAAATEQSPLQKMQHLVTGQPHMQQSLTAFSGISLVDPRLTKVHQHLERPALNTGGPGTCGIPVLHMAGENQVSSSLCVDPLQQQPLPTTAAHFNSLYPTQVASELSQSHYSSAQNQNLAQSPSVGQSQMATNTGSTTTSRQQPLRPVAGLTGWKPAAKTTSISMTPNKGIITTQDRNIPAGLTKPQPTEGLTTTDLLRSSRGLEKDIITESDKFGGEDNSFLLKSDSNSSSAIDSYSSPPDTGWTSPSWSDTDSSNDSDREVAMSDDLVNSIVLGVPLAAKAAREKQSHCQALKSADQQAESDRKKHFLRGEKLYKRVREKVKDSSSHDDNRHLDGESLNTDVSKTANNSVHTQKSAETSTHEHLAEKYPKIHESRLNMSERSSSSAHKRNLPVPGVRYQSGVPDKKTSSEGGVGMIPGPRYGPSGDHERQHCPKDQKKKSKGKLDAKSLKRQKLEAVRASNRSKAVELLASFSAISMKSTVWKIPKRGRGRLPTSDRGINPFVRTPHSSVRNRTQCASGRLASPNPESSTAIDQEYSTSASSSKTTKVTTHPDKSDCDANVTANIKPSPAGNHAKPSTVTAAASEADCPALASSSETSRVCPQLDQSDVSSDVCVDVAPPNTSKAIVNNTGIVVKSNTVPPSAEQSEPSTKKTTATKDVAVSAAVVSKSESVPRCPTQPTPSDAILSSSNSSKVVKSAVDLPTVSLRESDTSTCVESRQTEKPPETDGGSAPATQLAQDPHSISKASLLRTSVASTDSSTGHKAGGRKVKSTNAQSPDKKHKRHQQTMASKDSRKKRIEDSSKETTKCDKVKSHSVDRTKCLKDRHSRKSRDNRTVAAGVDGASTKNKENVELAKCARALAEKLALVSAQIKESCGLKEPVSVSEDVASEMSECSASARCDVITPSPVAQKTQPAVLLKKNDQEKRANDSTDDAVDIKLDGRKPSGSKGHTLDVSSETIEVCDSAKNDSFCTEEMAKVKEVCAPATALAHLPNSIATNRCDRVTPAVTSEKHNKQNTASVAASTVDTDKCESSLAAKSAESKLAPDSSQLQLCDNATSDATALKLPVCSSADKDDPVVMDAGMSDKTNHSEVKLHSQKEQSPRREDQTNPPQCKLACRKLFFSPNTLTTADSPTSSGLDPQEKELFANKNISIGPWVDQQEKADQNKDMTISYQIAQADEDLRHKEQLVQSSVDAAIHYSRKRHKSVKSETEEEKFLVKLWSVCLHYLLPVIDILEDEREVGTALDQNDATAQKQNHDTTQEQNHDTAQKQIDETAQTQNGETKVKVDGNRSPLQDLQNNVDNKTIDQDLIKQKQSENNSKNKTFLIESDEIDFELEQKLDAAYGRKKTVAVRNPLELPGSQMKETVTESDKDSIEGKLLKLANAGELDVVEFSKNKNKPKNVTENKKSKSQSSRNKQDSEIAAEKLESESKLGELKIKGKRKSDVGLKASDIGNISNEPDSKRRRLGKLDANSDSRSTESGKSASDDTKRSDGRAKAEKQSANKNEKPANSQDPKGTGGGKVTEIKDNSRYHPYRRKCQLSSKEREFVGKVYKSTTDLDELRRCLTVMMYKLRPQHNAISNIFSRPLPSAGVGRFRKYEFRRTKISDVCSGSNGSWLIDSQYKPTEIPNFTERSEKAKSLEQSTENLTNPESVERTNTNGL